MYCGKLKKISHSPGRSETLTLVRPQEYNYNTQKQLKLSLKRDTSFEAWNMLHLKGQAHNSCANLIYPINCNKSC